MSGIDDIARNYGLKRASDLPPKPKGYAGAADSRARGGSPDRSAGAGAADPRSRNSSPDRSAGAGAADSRARGGSPDRSAAPSPHGPRPDRLPHSAEPSGRRESAAGSKSQRESAAGNLKLTPAQAAAFRALQPAAIALVASDGPVSVTLWGASGVVTRLGHNRGIWPAKVARTGAWKDTVTATHDKSPFHFLGAQFRVWCLTEHKRDRVAEGVVELIARRAEADGGLDELLHGYQDLGPDLDLALFELEVHDIAARLGIQAWSDETLPRFLERVAARVEAERIAGRGLSRDADAYDLAAAKEALEWARGS